MVGNCCHSRGGGSCTLANCGSDFEQLRKDSSALSLDCERSITRASE